VNRYGPIERAVAASLLANAVLQLAVFVPGVGDGVPTDAKVVSLVTAAIAVAGAWGLWNRRTWGRRTTLVVTMLNVLGTIPVVFDDPGAGVTVLAVGTIVVGILVVAQLLSGDLKGEVGRPATV